MKELIPATRLAVVYSQTVLILQLLEAAAGRWQLLWLVDRSREGAEESLRMLRRLGTVVDITDLDPAAVAVRLAAHDPAGIIAFQEPDLLLASLVGTTLGLPVNSPAVTNRLTDKFAQRDALRAGGVAVPQFWAVPPEQDEAQREALLDAVNYPVVVKPRAGSGSRSTYRVTDASNLQAVLADTRDKTLIIEEEIPDGWPRSDHQYADFVSVESFVVDGVATHLVITGRATLAEPFRETGSFIPSMLNEAEKTSVEALASAALTALGVSWGCMHTEIKLSPDGPRVIEVNGRVGGHIPETLTLAGGPSVLEIACLVALGRNPDIAPFDLTNIGFSILVTAPVEAKRLIDLGGVEALQDVSGVHSVSFGKMPGDELDWREGYDSRLCLIFAAADGYDEMWAIRDQINTTLVPTYE